MIEYIHFSTTKIVLDLFSSNSSISQIALLLFFWYWYFPGQIEDS
jgi:hypothetical protein